MSTSDNCKPSPFDLMVDQMNGAHHVANLKLPSKVVRAGQVCKSKIEQPKTRQAPIALGDKELANKLIPLEKMKAYFGLSWSRMTYWRKEKSGDFVTPIRIGRQVYYRYGAVLEWIASQEAAGLVQGGGDE